MSVYYALLDMENLLYQVDRVNKMSCSLNKNHKKNTPLNNNVN